MKKLNRKIEVIEGKCGDRKRERERREKERRGRRKRKERMRGG